MESKIVQIPINTSGGGTARCIKANYWKMSLANFIHQDGLVATGVIEIVRYEDIQDISVSKREE